MYDNSKLNVVIYINASEQNYKECKVYNEHKARDKMYCLICGIQSSTIKGKQQYI